MPQSLLFYLPVLLKKNGNRIISIQYFEILKSPKFPFLRSLVYLAYSIFKNESSFSLKPFPYFAVFTYIGKLLDTLATM